jgi:hypothetical protein
MTLQSHDKLTLPHYLTAVTKRQHRRVLTSIRLGTHPLEIEVGRYCKPPLPPDERFCSACPNAVEDEKHFALDCTRYKSLRDDLFYSLGTDTIEHAPNNVSLLLNPPVCHSSTIANFIYQCLNIRKLTSASSSPPQHHPGQTATRWSYLNVVYLFTLATFLPLFHYSTCILLFVRRLNNITLLTPPTPHTLTHKRVFKMEYTGRNLFI